MTSFGAMFRCLGLPKRYTVHKVVYIARSNLQSLTLCIAIDSHHRNETFEEKNTARISLKREHIYQINPI